MPFRAEYCDITYIFLDTSGTRYWGGWKRQRHWYVFRKVDLPVASLRWLTPNVIFLGGVFYSIIFQQSVKSIGFGRSTRIMALFMFCTLVLPLSARKTRVQPSAARKLYDASACNEPPFCFFTLGTFFGFLGMNMPLYYVTKYAISYGMSSTLASYLLPVLNAASVAGCIISNVCKDTPFLHPCHKCLSLCLSNSMEQIRQAQ